MPFENTGTAVAPGFAAPVTNPFGLANVGQQARQDLAQICALGGRFDEAREWFDRARSELEEQGARPLRALVDLDEGWMEVRRGRLGDRERAITLLDAAQAQFETIGMSGWLRRAEDLRQGLTAENA